MLIHPYLGMLIYVDYDIAKLPMVNLTCPRGVSGTAFTAAGDARTAEPVCLCFQRSEHGQPNATSTAQRAPPMKCLGRLSLDFVAQRAVVVAVEVIVIVIGVATDPIQPGPIQP